MLKLQMSMLKISTLSLHVLLVTHIQSPTELYYVMLLKTSHPFWSYGAKCTTLIRIFLKMLWNFAILLSLKVVPRGLDPVVDRSSQSKPAKLSRSKNDRLVDQVESFFSLIKSIDLLTTN